VGLNLQHIKESNSMFHKKLYIAITLITLLALVPVSALAATRVIPYSGGTLTITHPDSYISCTPSDTITISGITAGHPVTIYFLRQDVTTGIIYQIGSSYFDADGSAPFPYPSVTGTMTFGIAIYDHSLGKQINGWKWTVTCQATGQGCTPGYWRQPQHLDDWVPTGYAPGDYFENAFLWPGYFSPTYTLFQAIWAQGGGLDRLARHGTAALLSAASPFVDYPYTVAEVIAMVHSGTIDPLAQANELGCPLH
jgi:hypothetical protein